jgi:hemolysin activation/secretion protein
MVTAIIFAVRSGSAWAQSPQQGSGLGGVLIKKIEFIGNTVIDTDTLQKTVKDFINRELTLEDMSELADLITMTYQEKGYILARAYLPEQEINDGVLKIAIAEGRIGKIVVSGKRHYHDRVVKRYFKEQEKKGVVNEALLEKALLYSKENEDIETEVVLKGGEKQGTVDVVFGGKDKSKVMFTAHLGLDYNNYGSELVGVDRFGLSLNIIDHNWGSKWKFRGVVANNVENTSLGLFDVMIPVNSYGTQLGVNYLDGDYLVGQDLADLGLEGRTTIFGLKALHPVFKKKNKDLTFTFGYDHKYTKNYIIEDVRSTDVLDELYGVLDYESLDRFLGKNIFSFGIYAGSLDDNPKYIPSRQDADIFFSRYKLSMTRIQRIFGYTNLMLRGTGQYTHYRLVPVEQIIVGGYGTVRGHTTSLFIGDYGYYASSELMFAPPFIGDKSLFGQRVAQLAQLALFFDTGAVFTTDTQPGEFDSEYLSGYGLGVRLFYKNFFTFKYDLGIPVDPRPPEDNFIHYFYFSFDLF